MDEETPKDSERRHDRIRRGHADARPSRYPRRRRTRGPDVDMHAVFSAMASLKGGAQIEDSEAALFALADVKTSGTGALPASGVIQPAW